MLYTSWINSCGKQIVPIYSLKIHQNFGNKTGDSYRDSWLGGGVLSQRGIRESIPHKAEEW